MSARRVLATKASDGPAMKARYLAKLRSRVDAGTYTHSDVRWMMLRVERADRAVDYGACLAWAVGRTGEPCPVHNDLERHHP